jgi:hypothetical protein
MKMNTSRMIRNKRPSQAYIHGKAKPSQIIQTLSDKTTHSDHKLSQIVITQKYPEENDQIVILEKKYITCELKR